MLDEKRLAEIRERAERATAGTWKVQLHNEDYGQGYGETTYFVEQGGELLKIGIADSPADYAKYSANANFIAHAREDVPALLDELARLRTIAENAQDCYVTEMAAHSRTRMELEAAKRDMRALSDEYKFCNMCKYHNGEGVDTCSHPLRFSCDAENFYDWRGVCPENTPDAREGGGEG